MGTLVAAGYFNVLNNSIVKLCNRKIFLLIVQFLTHLFAYSHHHFCAAELHRNNFRKMQGCSLQFMWAEKSNAISLLTGKQK